MTKKWKVDAKNSFYHGDKNNPERFGYEISVVHIDNEHGFNSYGWGGSQKIIIGYKDPNEYSAPFMFEEFMKLAGRIAYELNEKDVDFV